MTTPEQSRVWRAANLELDKAIDRRYYLKNRDVIRARSKAWRLQNPEKSRETRRKSQKKRSVAKVPRRHIEKELRECVTVELIRRDGFDCGICKTGLTGNIQIDHIVTVKDGGNNNLENLRLSHEVCNKSRNRIAA